MMTTTTNTTYTFSGLNPGKQYQVTVRAKDLSGNLSTPATVTGNTLSGDVTAPVLTITPSGNFYTTQQVTMSTNETATIYYTTDNSDPISSGTRLTYSAPITVSATTTIKAYALDTANNASAVQSVTYTKQTANFVTDQLGVFYDFTSLTSLPTSMPDSSGNGNNAVLNGYTSSAVRNGEFIGDGYGDFLTLPYNANLQKYPFSVEFYMQAHPGKDHTNTSYRIFDTNAGTGTGNGIFIGYTTPNNVSTPSVLNIGGNLSQPVYNVSFNGFDSVYHHIVVTWTQSVQKIYIDGTLVGTNNGTSTTLGTREMAIFGSGGTTATGQTLPHAARVFRYYTKELTQAEVTQNYNVLPKTFTPVDVTFPIITASPAPGTVSGNQTITLTSNETATIYYTVNGTNPTTASTVYTAPITLTAGASGSSKDVRVIAVDAAGNTSSLYVFHYTFS
jgi:hypothetical protein